MEIGKKNKIVLRKTHSNRRESIHWENKLNDSLNQWEEVKKDHEHKVEKHIYEEELKKRELEIKDQKQKIYLKTMKERSEQEQESFDRRNEIDEKIRNKKRLEMKKRDIIHRNKSVLG